MQGDNVMLRDYNNVYAVGFQVSDDGQRVWLCIDGECVLRVRGIKKSVGICDDRQTLDDKEE